ncbi:MAG TPA: ABC transporter ATP-binding protein [Streptosporangiaceae bacterium]|nr:ABC transporter ATP-binding protein [Streptosporangiaceae bacterium]
MTGTEMSGTEMTGAGMEGTSGSAPLLTVAALSVHHGQLQALREVSLEVPAGHVHAMIGANGAGKSTLLRTIAGLHQPTAGTVRLDGKDITGLRPERRVAAGIALVPEGRRLFPSLSVEENLLVGATSRRNGQWNLEAIYDLFGWMRDRRQQRAAQLSGGEQQAVAIGRALATNPRVLLLDELSLGLAPVVVRQIYALLPRLAASGMTILLVEQDVSQALAVASYVHCLLEGRVTLAGPPAALTGGQIEAAYFGVAAGGNGKSAPPGTPETAAPEADQPPGVRT